MIHTFWENYPKVEGLHTEASKTQTKFWLEDLALMFIIEKLYC